ncbi:penicillinase repressor [Clostridium homopropionicum DSM 5847]|uniref:Penicillinase repressor n=1 Tax=Clostridium homopropionicum DSM 5847 TaxID=1121318 RepID=A0A0L6Z6W4_9CLOT|nr:BlaI/MecI/CopY family transcriptional regulator [Clostridium homopropionicum]KOA18695.1 penicillinase repressor [Clostridium homopropionicum DSM 5847]SFG52966.1 BlaI family transcriptional regulator, penicillinase repressor [Clostridium homopropionicum]
MKNIPQISEAELEVMKILWELKKATSSEIVEKLLKTSEWKPKTIHTLITRLVSKEAIIAEKLDGKSYIYIPKVSDEEYKNYANKSFLQRVYNGSLNLMLSSFIKQQKLSKEDIEELKNILDKEIE